MSIGRADEHGRDGGQASGPSMSMRAGRRGQRARQMSSAGGQIEHRRAGG